MAYRHIVLFRIYDAVTSDAVDSAIARLQSLSELAMVESLRVERSLDGRKGRIIVLDSTFADEAAFGEYRADPQHIAVGEQMADVADWWVGDYREG
jgi:hypothetical protein